MTDDAIQITRSANIFSVGIGYLETTKYQLFLQLVEVTKIERSESGEEYESFSNEVVGTIATNEFYAVAKAAMNPGWKVLKTVSFMEIMQALARQESQIDRGGS